MYFSKNSRYVLRKAKCLSSKCYLFNCLNDTKRSFCVKSPDEDPTKPPLRLNIPGEPAKLRDAYSAALRDTTRIDRNDVPESRSKSLLPKTNKSSLKSNFEEDYYKFHEPENQIQISSNKSEGLANDNGFEVPTTSNSVSSEIYAAKPSQEGTRSDHAVIDHFSAQRTDTDHSEGLITVLNEKEFQDSFRERKLEQTSEIVPDQRKFKNEAKSQAKSDENSAFDLPDSNYEPKALYIIIDVPDKFDDNSASANTSYLSENKAEDSSGPPSAKAPKTQSFKNRNSVNSLVKARSKSLPRHLYRPIESGNSKVKFEVHEIDEAATYVFHLRFKKNFRGKACAVGCVPEKEINTRNHALSESEAALQIPGPSIPRTFKPLGNDIVNVEDRLEPVKYDTPKNSNPTKQDKKGNSSGIKKRSKSMKNLSNTWNSPKPKADARDDLNLTSNPQVGEQPKPEAVESKYYQYPKSFSKAGPSEYAHEVSQSQNAGRSKENSQNEVSLVCGTDSAEAKNEKNVEIFSENSGAKMPKASNTWNNYEQNMPENTEYYHQQWNSSDNHSDISNQQHNSQYYQQQVASGDGYSSSYDSSAHRQDSRNYYEQMPQNGDNRSSTFDQAPEAPQTKVKRKSDSLSHTGKKKSGKHKSEKGDRVEKKRGKDVKFSNASEGSDKHERMERIDGTDFQTTSSVIKISSEKPCYPMKFCAAYPPTLSDVMTNRGKGIGLRKRESLLQQNLNKINFRANEYETNSPASEDAKNLSENSILFPNNENKKFDCASLFDVKKETVLNVLKDDKAPKIGDNMVNIANETLTESKGNPSVDSLTMMKKVKEIVNFDLGNAVKIFEGRETEGKREVSSVLTKQGETWRVDDAELEKCVALQKTKLSDEIKVSRAVGDKSDSVKGPCKKLDASDNRETKIDGSQESFAPKYFPGSKVKEIVMKLENKNSDSTITGEHGEGATSVDKQRFKETICSGQKEVQSEDVADKLEELLMDGLNNQDTLRILAECFQNEFDSAISYEMKRGDSILVFDELTQTWKVDYSILERREEQIRQEEELTKRSELILETFEKLEKNNISKIPKPNSREKKIFDYSSEEWKAYNTDKKSKGGKTTKSKHPFKESDAEEIRRKNSDLYENLFVVNKKETKMSKDGKEAPGLNTGSGKKEAARNDKMAKTGESEYKGSDTTTQNSEPPVEEMGISHQKVEEETTSKENDNYWETFLKLNILPFDRPEAPKPPPSPTVRVPNPVTPPPPPKKIIQEPKFRFPNPFHWDKKIETPAIKKPENTPGKLPPPSKIGPTRSSPSPQTKPGSPSATGSRKKDEPTKKGPSPPAPPLPSQPKSPSSTGLQKKDTPSQSPSTKSAPPTPAGPAKTTAVKDPPSSPPQTRIDPRKKTPPTIGAPKKENAVIKMQNDTENSKASPSPDGKKEKLLTEHYVSDNIVEMSRSSSKDLDAKTKSNKVETVKLNITSDKRMPLKVTEINLNKKFDESIKVGNSTSKTPKNNDKKKVSDESLKNSQKQEFENRAFYRNFEKYKTPFSDPEYEEKTMKINSNIESNPNLKKLDNWSKTLVLHDIGKPNENIETWLKDETDKMATLLLKVLQEAAEGKPRKRPTPIKGKPGEKTPGKSNPYDSIRKKHETSPESFLFKVRSVNLALDTDKKLKLIEEAKQSASKIEPSSLKNIPVQSAKNVKPVKVVDAVKITPEKETASASIKNSDFQAPTLFADSKPKLTEITLDGVDSGSGAKELHQSKVVSEVTEDIPGPEILKTISSTWKLFPVIGCQMTIFTLLRIFQLVNVGTSFFTSAHPEKTRRHAFSKLFAKYGPIVNLQGPLSGNVILIHKPEHLSTVFEQDGLSSVRSVFDSLDHIRRETEDKVVTTGISTDWNKSEWSNLKKAVHDPNFNNCEKFLEPVELAADSLISNIRRNRNGQNFISEDFMEEIKKWSLEGLCNILFAKPMGFLESRGNQASWLLEPDKFYMAVEEATRCLTKCERGFQAWRLMTTPSLIGLGQAYRSLAAILSKQLYQGELNLKSKHDLIKNNSSVAVDLTLIESMLLFDGMTHEEITCNLIDVIVVGTNAMSSALGFLLYHLAQNVKAQHRLMKEIKEALPNKNDRLDLQKLRSLGYLQACLKETLRLNTPFPLFFRVLQNDIVLSNYIVPKGTYVVMDSRVSCMKEQIFDDPEKFVPERWMNDEKWLQKAHPSSSFPLCQGPRTDLARRIVEMQLCSCVAKIVRNFDVQYHFGEIVGTETIMSLPNKPLKLQFAERNQ